MAARKSKGVGDTAVAESQRLNVHISPEAHRRLGIHSVMSGETPGRIVERLITEHLRSWRVEATPANNIDRSGFGDSISLASLPASL
jgi:hypothetical protein